MSGPGVHLIVFSKDRPLQLHGYLTSVLSQWHGAVLVDVLVRDRAPYARAYYDLQREFRGRVRFGFESDFATNVDHLVRDGGAPLTCFGTDDAVFVAPVLVGDLVDVFAERDDILGVSLRLGTDIRRGMFGQPMPHPAFLPDPRRGYDWDAPPRAASLLWDCTAPGSEGDWAYPWEVVGTVYPTAFVRRVVAALVEEGLAGCPSHLEHHGATRWARYAEGRTLLRAWQRPRLVLPTVNVVQTVFGNGTVGGGELDPGFLLECWDRGLRLDTQRYAVGRTPDTWRVGDFYLRRAV